jgi:hypothetical protein
MQNTPRTVTVSFVRTRHANCLRVWVDGKRHRDIFAGTSGFEERARKFAADFADRHNCVVCAETEKWSDSVHVVFTLVFVLAAK